MSMIASDLVWSGLYQIWTMSMFGPNTVRTGPEINVLGRWNQSWPGLHQRKTKKYVRFGQDQKDIQRSGHWEMVSVKNRTVNVMVNVTHSAVYHNIAHVTPHVKLTILHDIIIIWRVLVFVPFHMRIICMCKLEMCILHIQTPLETSSDIGVMARVCHD